MLRTLLVVLVLAAPAFAATGVVIDFDRVLKQSRYGARASEAIEARAKGKTPAEKKKVEAEENAKVFEIAQPLILDYAKRARLDFVLLARPAVLYAAYDLGERPTTALVRALDQHLSAGQAVFDSKDAMGREFDNLTFRVAIVNADAVFEGSKTGRALLATMKQETEAAQAELDALQAEAREAQKKLEAEKKGTAEYEAANSAAVDKLRAVMIRKEMREYEMDFRRKHAFEEFGEALRVAAGKVARSQGYNLVLSGTDARVVGMTPSILLTQGVAVAIDAPEKEVPGAFVGEVEVMVGKEKKKFKKPREPAKSSSLATVSLRKLWGQVQKLDPKAEPGARLQSLGAQYVPGAGLDLLLDEESFLYANPALDRTAALGAKLSGE